MEHNTPLPKFHNVVPFFYLITQNERLGGLGEYAWKSQNLSMCLSLKLTDCIHLEVFSCHFKNKQPH